MQNSDFFINFLSLQRIIPVSTNFHNSVPHNMPHLALWNCGKSMHILCLYSEDAAKMYAAYPNAAKRNGIHQSVKTLA